MSSDNCNNASLYASSICHLGCANVKSRNLGADCSSVANKPPASRFPDFTMRLCNGSKPVVEGRLHSSVSARPRTSTVTRDVQPCAMTRPQLPRAHEGSSRSRVLRNRRTFSASGCTNAAMSYDQSAGLPYVVAWMTSGRSSDNQIRLAR